MWISDNKKWHKNQTELEKFMIERIIQRCDNSENISEKHRTTSGYTLIDELVNLTDLTIKRPKTIYTLISVLNESLEASLKQNVKNDFIFSNYFKDIEEYLKNQAASVNAMNADNINLQLLVKFSHELKKFKDQLDLHYFASIKSEILSINFKNNKSTFNRRAKKLSGLLDLLITYVVHRGYSVSSFYEIFTLRLEEDNRITAKKLLTRFNFTKKRFYFLHKFNKSDTELVKDFNRLLKEKYGLSPIKSKPIEVDDIDISDIKTNETDLIVRYKTTCVDPQSFSRKLYDDILKDLLVFKDRKSLSLFNNFFFYTYWGFAKNIGESNLKPVKMPGDPINVQMRKNTLLRTYFGCQKRYNYTVSDNKLPLIENKKLNNSIFYFNMAIRSKSIENSLSLLWTSLEALLPYRSSTSDIVSIQSFVSKTLSQGSIARNLQAFAYRFYKTYGKKHDIKLPIGSKKLDDNELEILFNKILNTNDDKGKETCVKIAEQSNLLAFLYSSLGEKFSATKLKALNDRIETSEKSIIYQLQRIYSYRNLIVHSGEMVSEYTNLWLHLEWYVGKLLFYAVLKIEIKNESESLEDCFRKLEAEGDYIKSYLNKNDKKETQNLSERIQESLFKNYWQSF